MHYVNTAQAVIERSETPVTTRTGYGVPADHFTAVVTRDGVEYEYLFPGGAWHMEGDAVMLGRIHRLGFGKFRAVGANGVVGNFPTREAAFKALITY